MIDAGEYTFKITEANIRVNKQKKKFLMLKLEVQGGDYEGANLYHAMIPWNNFNWMHNIKSIFTEFDIQTYMLEYSDEDTMWVVSQLAVGEIVTGKVRHARTYSNDMREYNSISLHSKVAPCRTLNESYPAY